MTRARSTLRAILTATLAIVLFTATPRSHLATAATSTPIGPKTYYLALGDSLAYGKQPDGDSTNGYADDLAAYLQTISPITLVDMGCPSETSTTFINGGCPYAKLVKYPYSGPQLAAALAFLQQHPGQVSPVTLDLGINDMKGLFNSASCTLASPQTVAQALATYDANLSSILSQLQTALHGGGDLLLMTNYFAHQNQCPNTLTLAETFNDHLEAAAQQYGAMVAPVFDAFGGAATPNGDLCADTWICSTYQDIHPTTQGYAVIAATLEGTLHYTATPSPTATTTAPAPTATATATTPAPTATPTLPAPTATAIPSATPSPSPSPTAPSPFRRGASATATLLLSRSSGSYKDTLTAMGLAFAPGEPLAFYLDSAATPPLATVTAADDGSASASITVPQTNSGAHTLLAVGQSSGLTATAPLTIVPGAYLEHYQGYKGTVDVLRGAGFAPYETVVGYWQTPGGTPFAVTAETNSIGTFGGSASYPGITFTAPLSPTGTYNVIAVGQSSGGVAQRAFTLAPHLQLSPSSGAAGSSLRVIGTGFGANETVTLTYTCAMNTCGTAALASMQTDANGYLSAPVTIPLGTSAGTASIGATGATSGAFGATTFTVTP